MKASALAAAAVLAMWIQSAAALEYQAFDGNEGYQSIKVSNEVHYVAYHGTRASSIEEVSMGWKMRGAEICQGMGMRYFVELAYVFEPLTAAEIRNMESSTAPPSFLPARGTAPIYVPIYVPSGPRYASINAPSRLGAIRCISSPDMLADRARAVEVGQTLEAARVTGVVKPAAAP